MTERVGFDDGSRAANINGGVGNSSSKIWLACWGVAVAMLGCGGKGVALSSSTPQIIASPDPEIFGTIRTNVVQLEVDDARIYWRGSSTWDLPLQACDKLDCAATPTQLSSYALGPFHAAGGQVDWFGFDGPGEPDASFTGWPLVTAARDGTNVRTLWDGDCSDVAFSTDTAFVLTTSDAMPDAQGQSSWEFDAISLIDGTSRTVVMLRASHLSLTSLVKGDYLYWIDFDPNTAPGVSPTSIARARIDGSGSAETLVSGIPFVTTRTRSIEDRSPYLTNLVVDDQYIYWADNSLYGSLLRYPLSGGDGTPQTVLSPIRSPLRLLLEGATLYFTYELDAFSYAVSKCAVSGCTPSAPLATQLEDPRVLALDEQYLYTVTSTANLGNTNYTAGGFPRLFVGQVRRFAK